MTERPAPSTNDETIVAVATPPGRGGVGIVRVSGNRSRQIAESFLGHCPPARAAVYRAFRDGSGRTIDEGIALYFEGPASFTGEDVLELQGHGGPQVMDMLVASACELGARMARAGEFSLRAFLNDRLDLSQAEAIADLIDSGSEEAARAAVRSMQGEFSRKVHGLVEAITGLRMFVEAAIDFPEEEIDFLSDPELVTRMQAADDRFKDLRSAAKQGCLLREGMTVVIAGRPNAGKSSLLNRLAGYDAAIVTDQPGTTRDVLRERIHIDGMPLHVLDTAGLREGEDEAEREGVRRAQAEAGRADLILLVEDASSEDGEGRKAMVAQLPADVAVMIIRNKIDLTHEQPSVAEGEQVCVSLSVKSGAGMELLAERLKSLMGYRNPDTGTLSARRRHLQALEAGRTHFEAGRRQLEQAGAGELMAEELRLAQRALGEITGEVTSDDLLGRIFASFCIGK